MPNVTNVAHFSSVGKKNCILAGRGVQQNLIEDWIMQTTGESIQKATMCRFGTNVSQVKRVERRRNVQCIMGISSSSPNLKQHN